MVCNPNNPTGAVLTEGEMDAVVAVAERVGAWIVADEIYRGAEVDTDATSPDVLGPLRQASSSRAGCRRRSAMPGLRIGWAVAPPKVIERHLGPPRLHDADARACSRTGSPASRCSPTSASEILERTRGIVRIEPARTSRSGSPHHPTLAYVRPVAGAIAYASYDLPIGSTALVDRIRQEQSVLLVPGDMFGHGKGLRFGFGYDVEHTLKGLARVDDTLSAIAGER